MTDERLTYAVRWSDEDDAFVATVAEFPSLSFLHSDAERAVASLSRLVATVRADLAAGCADSQFPDDTGW